MVTRGTSDQTMLPVTDLHFMSGGAAAAPTEYSATSEFAPDACRVDRAVSLHACVKYVWIDVVCVLLMLPVVGSIVP